MTALETAWVWVGCILIIGGLVWWWTLPTYSRYQRARGVV